MNNIPINLLILKRKIIFRADGNSAIGMGHFVRSLALAEMLNKEFYCIFATQSPSTYQISEIEKICHERFDLPVDETHFDLFLHALTGQEIIVLDNYYFSTEYQQDIKNKGCKLVCIDDLHDKHFVADVVINHAEGVEQSRYSAEEYTKFCLGYKYALLRKEYLDHPFNKRKKQNACLVIIGGTDPYNITEKIVSMIDPKQISLPMSIVIGSEAKNENSLKGLNNISLYKSIGAAKIFQLMQESQFGIFPASTVAIEACAARLPFICGYYVENQKQIYNGIEKKKLGYCIGNLLTTTPTIIFNAIEFLNKKYNRDKMKKKQSRLLDKKSKDRYIKIFNEL